MRSETPVRVEHIGTKGRLRRLNRIMLLPPLAVVGVLLVAVDARNWWEAVMLSVGVAAGLLAFVRWTAGDLLRVALPCLTVAAAVWVVGVLLTDCHTAFYSLLLVGPLVIPRLPRRQGQAALALTVLMAAVGALRLLVTQDEVLDVLIQYVIIPTGVTVVVTGLMFPNQWFYDAVAELEESREREAELAVARERIRFAGDLHDIQGHTLHVVKLKIVLAQKLLHSDIDRVEEELREVHALVGDTIDRTKELAHAQHRLNLPAELENAKNLFEAAGILVDIEREAEVGSGAGELLGQVLRETTTNILRHAQAEHVRITLSASGIAIVNDGVPDDLHFELGGLAILKERVAGNGGELTVEQSDGRFLTAAAFPHREATAREGGR